MDNNTAGGLQSNLSANNNSSDLTSDKNVAEVPKAVTNVTIGRRSDGKFAKVLEAKTNDKPAKEGEEVRTDEDGLPILDNKQTSSDKKAAAEVKLKLISLYKAALKQIEEANEWNVSWEGGNGVMDKSESKIHAMQVATEELEAWKRKHGLGD